MDVEIDVDNVDICRLCKQNQGYGATMHLWSSPDAAWPLVRHLHCPDIRSLHGMVCQKMPSNTIVKNREESAF